MRVLVPDVTMDGSVRDWDNTKVCDVTWEKTEGFGLFKLRTAATVRHLAIKILVVCKWVGELRTAARFLVEGGQW